MKQVLPLNRRVMISIQSDEDQEKSPILLPEDYNTEESPHIHGTVLSTSSEVGSVLSGDVVYFPRHMLETLDVGGEEFYFVLENYVVAAIKTN